MQQEQSHRVDHNSSDDQCSTPQQRSRQPRSYRSDDLSDHDLRNPVLDDRLAVLDTQLRSYGSLLVAFSGGADSAFLLAAAVRALGPDRVVAATAVSP